jgi:hypothetical protein
VLQHAITIVSLAEIQGWNFELKPDVASETLRGRVIKLVCDTSNG